MTNCWEELILAFWVDMVKWTLSVGVADHAATGPGVASQPQLIFHMLRSQEVPCTALREDIQHVPGTLVDDIQEKPMETVLCLRLGKAAAAMAVPSQCSCLCLRPQQFVQVQHFKNEVKTHSTK